MADETAPLAPAQALLQESGLCGALSPDRARACALDDGHAPPCGWHRYAGLRQLQPGVYTDDDGTLHLDLPELARAHGADPTPENIATLEAAALSIFGDLPGVAVEVRDHGEQTPQQRGEPDATHEP